MRSNVFPSRAREIDADLIVMTSHGRTGLSRMWLGSVADGLIRHSRVPVLLLRPIDAAAPRPFAHGLYKHILVPFDGSAASEEVLPAALALAKCGSARISLLRVVPADSARFRARRRSVRLHIASVQ